MPIVMLRAVGAVIAALTVVAGVVTGAGSATAVEPNGTGSLNGRVVTSDGRPLPPADSILISARSYTPGLVERSVTPTADGNYNVKDLPAATYTVWLGVRGRWEMVGDPESVVVETGQVATRDLTVAQQTSFVSRVYDSTGKRLANSSDLRERLCSTACVELGEDWWSPDRPNARTVEPGDYRLRVDRSDGATQWWSASGATSDESQAGTITIPAGQEVSVDVHLVVQSTIVGRITASDGQPLTDGGLHITAYRDGRDGGHMIFPDAAGEFHFWPGVDPGTYRLLVEVIGSRTHSTQWYGGSVDRAGASPVVVTNGSVTTVQIRLGKNAVIVGRVKFPRGTRPDPDVTHVTAWYQDQDQVDGDQQIQAPVNRDGTFRLEGLVPGRSYSVFVREFGRLTTARPIRVVASGDQTIALKLRAVAYGRVTVKTACPRGQAQYVTLFRYGQVYNWRFTSGGLTFGGLAPGTYSVRLSNGRQWKVIWRGKVRWGGNPVATGRL